MEETEVSKAVKTLIAALANDLDFYETYQANLACCFLDGCKPYFRESFMEPNIRNFYLAANCGATKFLELFIGDARDAKISKD